MIEATYKAAPSTARHNRPEMQQTMAMRLAAERARAEQCNAVPMASKVGYVNHLGHLR